MRRAWRLTRALAVAVAALATAGGAAAAEDPGHGGELHPPVAGAAPGLAPAPAAPLAPASAPAPRGVAVTDHAVVPAALVVPAGARVIWTNVGRNRHTVTAEDGSFESGTLVLGATFSITAPAVPGRYGYFCRFHRFIRGSMTVSALDLRPPEAVAFDRPAVLTGTVPGAATGTQVALERRLPGRWERVAVVATGADGAFTARSPALRGAAAFRALSGAAVSPSVRAAVRPTVIAQRHGAHVGVWVRPARAGAPLLLERLNLDTYRWRPVARARLVRGGTAGFALRRPGVYRVRAVAHRGLVDGSSALLRFRPASFVE